MRVTTSLICAALLLVMSKCDKSDDNTTAPGHCNGLVTDTSGTGDPGKIYIPSAFTLNGDGLNDIIKPITQNIQSITFTIYDESNNVLFLTQVLNQGWSPVSINNFCNPI